MKKIIFLTFLIASFSVRFLLADVRPVSGAAWKTMSQRDKELYISGLVEGSLIYERQLLPPREEGGGYEVFNFFPQMSFENWIVALDKFYENEKNVYVAVVPALHAVKMLISGVKDEDIENYLDTERKAGADIVQKMKHSSSPGLEGGDGPRGNPGIDMQNYFEDTIPLAGGTKFKVLVNATTGVVEYFWRPAEGWLPASGSHINFQELYKIRQTLQLLPGNSTE